jgi:hypothetical protein
MTAVPVLLTTSSRISRVTRNHVIKNVFSRQRKKNDKKHQHEQEGIYLSRLRICALEGASARRTGCPTYVICSCCGFEFGFDDDSEGHTYSTYRKQWIDQGFPFFIAKKRPANWNIRTMKRQLANTGNGDSHN